MVKSLVSKLTSNLTTTVGGGAVAPAHGVQETTNYAKYRNDPGRFFGDGVRFKAKLIGILEVGEPRGDRMCQEALQDLKMALRAAGEHKQRITIHVTIDGLRLRDEKTSDSLYHHPVHKISFIAQDMTDSRAFGYIFGSPDSGHRFFGIKTDKAASQVVLAMRDLFQVVFELKKKEIELARQQIQSKSLHDHTVSSLSSLKSLGSSVVAGGNSLLHNDLSGGSGSLIHGGISGGVSFNRLGVGSDSRDIAVKELSPESVADLVDLEQELSSLQRGITQMERITPNEQKGAVRCSSANTNDEDPFGDSFANFPQTFNLLPPPGTNRSRNKAIKTSCEPMTAGSLASGANAINSSALSALMSPTLETRSSSQHAQHLPKQASSDESWLNDLDRHRDDIFDTSKGHVLDLGMGFQSPRVAVRSVAVDTATMAPLALSESTATPTKQLNEQSIAANSAEFDILGKKSLGNASVTAPAMSLSSSEGEPVTNAVAMVIIPQKSDAFTDLDPLGTGRTRPYVDKKYFFQELKNPPKKVLRDLSGENNNCGAIAPSIEEFLSADAGGSGNIEQGVFSQQHQKSSLTLQHILNTTDIGMIPTSRNSAPLSLSPPESNSVVMLARDTDPFSPTRKKSDPFEEGADIFVQLDSFDTSGGGSTHITPAEKSEVGKVDVFNGPLQVTLPPEEGLMGNGSTIRSRPVANMLPLVGAPVTLPLSGSSAGFKQQTVDVVLSSISSKKMPHLFGQSRFTKRVGGGIDSNGINMRRLQESGDSLSETETAPEPPPRPDSVSHVEPPPLPPKKQFNDIVIRPRITSGNAVPLTSSMSVANASTSARYELLTSSSKTATDVPPIPLPSRRIGRSDGAYPGPGRPRKPGHTDDDYLAPLSELTKVPTLTTAGIGLICGGSDVPPPLLPPPMQTSMRGRTQRQQSVPKSHDIYENKLEIIQQQELMQQQRPGEAQSVLPDITLSQLLTLGIDELATKLCVPLSKLSTMTLVELTSYLAEFLEQSKSRPSDSNAVDKRMVRPATQTSATVFKVDFDQQSTFVAKFDDTFGEDVSEEGESCNNFVANFAQFNDPPVNVPLGICVGVPSADRYAVFREIIDQELQQKPNELESTDLLGSASIAMPETFLTVATLATPNSAVFEVNFDADDFIAKSQETNTDVTPSPQSMALQLAPTTKIDTKITDVVAQAKDRYAALRDIILVENLFDQPQSSPLVTGSVGTNRSCPTTNGGLLQEFAEFGEEDFTAEDQDLKLILESRMSNTVVTAIDPDGRVDSCNLPVEPSSSAITVQDDDDDDEEDEDEEDEDAGGDSSLESNEKEENVRRCGSDDETSAHVRSKDQYEKLSTSNQQLNLEKLERSDCGGIVMGVVLPPKPSTKFLTVGSNQVATGSGLSSSKDDLEIDELMQRAISNLSLDSREHISPAVSTNTPALMLNGAGDLERLNTPHQQFTDMSTSPIPVKNLPVLSSTASITAIHPDTLLMPAPSVGEMQSPQLSSLPTQLSAVSNLIDTATRQMTRSGTAKNSWATFESPEIRIDENRKSNKTALANMGSLYLPPPPPSNASQIDTPNDSPCSSDPRDDVSGGITGWTKSLGNNNVVGNRGGGGRGGAVVSRRWSKKERQHTSSSSRDLSPWDDELSDYQKHKRLPAPPPLNNEHRHGLSSHAGFYNRHTRRMNSCDEDYGYEEEMSTRRDRHCDRDGRKFKQVLSRSRDNFDLDSPSCYHNHYHSGAPISLHHTWTPQDVEKAVDIRTSRAGFDRGAYERTTYGPPVYDKRGLSLPPPPSSSSGGASGSYEKRKYSRECTRPPYCGGSITGEYSEEESLPAIYRGSRAVNYENVYNEGYKGRGRGGDYKFSSDWPERKSFDRDSIESYESGTPAARRRRSFGSGDVYGSLDSRDDLRERYIGNVGLEKARSLSRKSTKLRSTAGELDYEKDLENEFTPGGMGQHTGSVGGRNMQRPNQLATVLTSCGGGGPSRPRKSSGSSPWDGEDLPLPGQKGHFPATATPSWKRPASATDSEQRRQQQRPSYGQTPSGSDGEKERRYRRKQRSRGREPPSSCGRYANYEYGGFERERERDRECNDYVDDDDYADEDDYEDKQPTDEDKFERLNRRRRDMHQRMLESERRPHTIQNQSYVPYASNLRGKFLTGTSVGLSSVRNDYHDEIYLHNTANPPLATASGTSGHHQHKMSCTGSTDDAGINSKFSFDGGFESDFNQSSPAPAGIISSCNSTPQAATTPGESVSATTTPATKSSFRFSNDFSERDKLQQAFSGHNSTSVSSLQQFDLDSGTSPAAHSTPPVVTQKLRFDDNVKVSQFDATTSAFEDDFSKAHFEFDKAHEWETEPSSTVMMPAALLPTSSMVTTKKQNLRNNRLQQRQDLIKKSESINIFAKKVEDPFEDDEFFQAAPQEKNDRRLPPDSSSAISGPETEGVGGGFQWDEDNNFAQFDENM